LLLIIIFKSFQNLNLLKFFIDLLMLFLHYGLLVHVWEYILVFIKLFLQIISCFLDSSNSFHFQSNFITLNVINFLNLILLFIFKFLVLHLKNINKINFNSLQFQANFLIVYIRFLHFFIIFISLQFFFKFMYQFINFWLNFN
jgi:hypothetical protein